MYQAMSVEHILSVFGSDGKDDIINQLDALKTEYVEQGTTAKMLAYENGKLIRR